MKWHNTDIDKLSDDDLKSAYTEVSSMWETNETTRNSPEFAKRIGNNSLPHVNPIFVGMMKTIGDEMLRRGLKP